MYRIDNDTAAAALPAASDPGPNPDGYFTGGDPQAGTPATIVEAEWANMMQEEIARAVEGAGLALDKADRGQLLAAMQAILGTGGKLKSVQVFTSSGTWNRPAGITRALVEVIGAGGGGGGCTASASAAGAGAGGYAKKLLDVSAIASSTITIGAKGVGGAAGSNNGSGGGDSSWDDGTNTLMGFGGGRGNGNSAGAGLGGTATGGDLNAAGGAGQHAFDNAIGNHRSGAGGNSVYGGGGVQGGEGTPGADGGAPGAGGSGGCGNGVDPQPGGDGADGIIIVWEYE